MINARITFHKCIQDSKLFGSDDQRMVSRIFLSIEVQDQRYPDIYVDVHQEPGSTFEEGALQVGPIQGYSGPLNSWAFQQAAEAYYRSLAQYELARVKVPFGKNARRFENVVIHESTVNHQVYE